MASFLSKNKHFYPIHPTPYLLMFPLHWIAEILQAPKHYTRLIIRKKKFQYDLLFSHNISVTDRQQADTSCYRRALEHGCSAPKSAAPGILCNFQLTECNKTRFA